MTADAGKSKPSRLGRGLSSLIGEVEAVAPAGDDESGTPEAAASEVAVTDIRANPGQPRQVFNEAALDELAESIRTRGVLQAILLRPDPKAPGQYQIVAGERRWRAAKRAGLSHIPAVVRDMDELALLEVGIIENVQRTDLNPVEEAEAYDALMKRFGRTQEGLAESVGKSRAHIANTLRLLALPEAVREHLREGRLSAGHARALLTAPEPETLAERAISRGLSVRDVEALARRARESTDEPGSGASSDSEEKDVDTQALEADLTRSLGLSVEIRHKKDRGELRIKYRDLEQLDEVCRKLTASR
ncbi:MAG: ParB/RepB/Spo0J family partition protein [Alphaproteobacteria bacterium]|jgi:ParB family chromosome partitioning protein|nr:ParB/RepB/Spo0J family partition protein [Alphaproteobacteria bacterium]